MNFQKNIAKKQFGFSLFEVIISLNIAAILVLMMSRTHIELQQEDMRTQHQSFAFLELNNLAVIHQLESRADVTLLLSEQIRNMQQYWPLSKILYNKNEIGVFWGAWESLSCEHTSLPFKGCVTKRL